MWRAGILARRFADWWNIWSLCRTRSNTAGCWTSPGRFSDSRASRSRATTGKPLYDASIRKAREADWPQQVLRESQLEAVFLTNDFDDPLVGWDTRVYIPCLRTDELVFRLHDVHVRQRLEAATNVSISNPRRCATPWKELFDHFVTHEARACAISLPPDFAPTRVSEGRAATAWEQYPSGGPWM